MSTTGNPHRLAVVLVAGAAVFLARPPRPAVADDGFRCESGRLVGVGDHMYEVQNKCGEPDFTGQHTEKRTVKVKLRSSQGRGQLVEEVTEEREVEVIVDEWVYDMGPNRFVRRVHFENGRVVNVGSGRYGNKRR